MCILSGFPTALKSTTSFPFGVWFADPNTLYVTDEGNGDTTYSSASGIYTTAAAQKTAGFTEVDLYFRCVETGLYIAGRVEPRRALHRH